MPEDLKLGVIVASTREGRRGEAIAHWFHAILAARLPDATQAELIDLRDFRLPSYDYPSPPMVAERAYTEATARTWVDKVASLDGYVVVTPEYNHSFPGGLKNAIDHAFTGWANKPIGFVSYGGMAGGARAVEQLRLVAIELRLVPVRDEVNLKLGAGALDAHGQPAEEIQAKRAAALADTLLWWARVAKDGRANHPLR